jgi:hypothetical protein
MVCPPDLQCFRFFKPVGTGALWINLDPDLALFCTKAEFFEKTSLPNNSAIGLLRDFGTPEGRLLLSIVVIVLVLVLVCSSTAQREKSQSKLSINFIHIHFIDLQEFLQLELKKRRGVLHIEFYYQVPILADLSSRMSSTKLITFLVTASPSTAFAMKGMIQYFPVMKSQILKLLGKWEKVGILIVSCVCLEEEDLHTILTHIYMYNMDLLGMIWIIDAP